MFNQEYVAAQARDEKGFVIVRTTKVADELKPFMTEIENYKGEIKNSGIKLNVDFHNTMNALKNYIADNNLKNAQEFDEIIGNIQAEVENGTFASKAKPSNYQGTKATPRATKETSSQKTSDFKPLLNEQGYVVVFKPKNETQAQISELFNIYFNENLKGKNFPKDLINDFNSSRNFHTGQESSKETIDKFFAGFDKRVDYFEKAANKTPSLDEVLDVLKNLTKDVASIKKAPIYQVLSFILYLKIELVYHYLEQFWLWFC